jgi:hypothetical protein
MSNRSNWKAMVLAIPMLAGCAATAVHSPGGTRLLTTAEMDRATAGSADAVNDVAAHALSPRAETTTSATTLAISGSSPIAGPPFLSFLSPNYSNSQGVASATSGQLAEASGSSHISVSGAGGGASIDATGTGIAAGGRASQAQMTMQFYGLTIGQVDLVFGSAVATACCAPLIGTQVTVDGGAGGPYRRELQGAPLSDIPGQSQSRVDIAVASSALPIVDPGQVMGLLTPRGSPLY